MSDRALDIALKARRGSFEVNLEARLSGSDVTAILGPNGAGKSTLLRLIAGLDTAQAGYIRAGSAVWFDAAARTALPAWKRPVGMVFQTPALFDHLDVAGNLAYADKRAPQSSKAISSSDIIDALDLAPLLKQRPASLSGGERQRVALGRALLTRPDWLLLDEPLSALDRTRRAQTLPYLRDVLKQFEIPTLLVSHSLDEVADLADKALILSEGTIVAHGPVDDVLARYDIETAEGRRGVSSLAMASVEHHDAGLQLTHLAFEDQTLEMPLIDDILEGTDIRLRIRARDVALALNRPQGTSIRNILSATIADIQADPASGFGHVLLDIGNTKIRARLTRASIEGLGLKPAQPVFALIRSVSFER